MNNSLTSSEIDGTINYLDNKGNNMNKDTNIIKKDTTETDLYLNMVANTNKVLQESEKSSSSLKLDPNNSENNSSVINSSTKSSVTSKVNFEEFQLPDKNKINNNENFNNNLIDSIVSNHSNRSNQSNESNQSKRSNTIESETKINTTETKEVSSIPVLTPQQIRLKKIELLRKLSEL